LIFLDKQRGGLVYDWDSRRTNDFRNIGLKAQRGAGFIDFLGRVMGSSPKEVRDVKNAAGKGTAQVKNMQCWG
jgi:hypothetical protein